MYIFYDICIFQNSLAYDNIEEIVWANNLS